MTAAAMTHDTDVLIIGAGPSGLALSRALADAQLRSIVIDGQPAHSLADPAPVAAE